MKKHPWKETPSRQRSLSLPLTCSLELTIWCLWDATWEFVFLPSSPGISHQLGGLENCTREVVLRLDCMLKSLGSLRNLNVQNIYIRISRANTRHQYFLKFSRWDPCAAKECPCWPLCPVSRQLAFSHLHERSLWRACVLIMKMSFFQHPWNTALEIPHYLADFPEGSWIFLPRSNFLNPMSFL